MSGFYGGAPGKDFLISQTFDSLDELKSAASEKHRDVVAGDYVLIYKIEDENNGELWLRLARPDEPLYKNFYKEIIKVTETFGYGLVGNLSGPRGFTPYIGENEHWWIAGVDTNKPSRGTGVKKINAAPRQFTAEEWTTHGALGHHEAWDTSSYDNSHILPKDTAYLTGTVTDAFDSEGEPIEAALFLVVTDVSASTITGDSVFVLKGSHGSVEPLDEKTATTLTGILEARDGTLHVATSIPTDLIAKNTKEQDGIVPAPTSAHGNSLWATDGEGNPSWQNLGFQNAEQVKSIVDKAIAESGHAVFKKVDKVPESAEAEDNVLYLVFNNRTKHYDIYAKIGSEVLLIDDTTVDLSNYASLQDLAKKVDKVDGKQLSTNDYTTEEKTKLSGIATGAQVNVIEKVKVNGTPLVPDAEKAVDVKAYNEDNKPEVGGRNYFALSLSSSGYLSDDNSGNIVPAISAYKERTSDYIEILEDDTNFTCQIWATSNDDDPRYSGFIGWQFFSEKNPGSKCSNKLWHYGGNLGYIHQIAYIKDIPQEAKYIRVCARFYNDGKMKFERGEIATDWTPAPEDLEAEIPTKTSELQNDSGFITQADIPEGAAASNTVPKAPAATGSVGNELAFARGDHVHPYGNRIADSSTTPYRNGIQFAFGGNVDEQFTKDVYPVLAGLTTDVSIPFFGATSKQFYKQQIGYAEISDITATNFSGILPIEKGGTGNNRGKLTLDSWHVDSVSWNKIPNSRSLHFGYFDDPCVTNYFFDTTGKSGGADVWCNNLHANNLPTIATSTTAGLVKPGTNCSVTNDGILNVTVPASYTLPAASSTTLGGVKVGANLSVTTDGTLSANVPSSYTLPPASYTAIGGIKLSSTQNELNLTSDGELFINPILLIPYRISFTGNRVTIYCRYSMRSFVSSTEISLASTDLVSAWNSDNCDIYWSGDPSISIPADDKYTEAHVCFDKATFTTFSDSYTGSLCFSFGAYGLSTAAITDIKSNFNIMNTYLKDLRGKGTISFPATGLLTQK